MAQTHVGVAKEVEGEDLAVLSPVEDRVVHLAVACSGAMSMLVEQARLLVPDLEAEATRTVDVRDDGHEVEVATIGAVVRVVHPPAQ